MVLTLLGRQVRYERKAGGPNFLLSPGPIFQAVEVPASSAFSISFLVSSQRATYNISYFIIIASVFFHAPETLIPRAFPQYRLSETASSFPLFSE